MQYMEPSEAQARSGLRLALTANMPAPYSMSARAILDVKQVPYIPVRQVGGGSNKDLVAWTGHRNAPVAMLDDEAPRTGWLDILNLAERIGQGPSLMPATQAHRMQLIAWTHELIGEGGWVWHMRLLMLGLGGEQRAQAAAQKNPMYTDYGYSEVEHGKAKDSATAIMQGFAGFALEQLKKSPYLIGDKLSALDIYWLYFSQIMQTLPDETCPMPGMLRASYDGASEACGYVVPELIEQRNWILAHHPQLPLNS